MARLGRQRRDLEAQLRYLWALILRFRFTFVMLFVLVGGGGLALYLLYLRMGAPVRLSRAVTIAYFLLFAQPITDLPDYGPIELVSVLIPPLGILTVAEGLVRFAYLFFAKNRNDKEWFQVLAQTMKEHVIVCGAGRVGFRIFEQLLKLDVPMAFVERDEGTQFVTSIRAAGVPVLIADVRAAGALEQANIKAARALICATDDDLANLNLALDARKLRPGIRVVMRLFDDDLVAKTKATFEVEAFSTSALAAPALAVAALDPSIRNSFEVGGRLMVVAELKVDASLCRTVGSLRDDKAVLVLHLVKTDGRTIFDPAGSLMLDPGDRVTLQATLQAYQLLRQKQRAA
jgi:Trk K+ transport system NAD-binding subunit